MSIQPTTESSTPLTVELEAANRINTVSLFDDSIFNAALEPLKVHLEKENVEQNVLDRCLLSGFQIVQRKDREMHQVAPTLQLLLQHGAQWKDGALLEHEMTPCHLICQSTGDHHELLDWTLKSSDRTLINTKDKSHSYTALLYAVRNANINCVRTLIAKGADVNIIGPHWCGTDSNCLVSPIVMVIERLQPAFKQLSSTMTVIFNLLLDNGAYIHKTSNCDKSYDYVPICYAIHVRNVKYVIKCIKQGAKLNAPDYDINDFWSKAARLGSVNLIKCLLNHGIDKDSTDQHGISLLTRVVESGDVEAVRYLLNLGVTVTTHPPAVKIEPCQKCRTPILSKDGDKYIKGIDPCRMAIEKDKLEIVKMLVEHGSQRCQFISSLVLAAHLGYVSVVEYLFNTYTYDLNFKFIYPITGFSPSYCTILTMPCYRNTIKIKKLLLDHGADPNMKICVEEDSSILLEAIEHGHKEVIALYIRNGVDVNFRSFDEEYGMVLPFEGSVLYDQLYATEMLLVSGCSYGMFSLDKNQEMKDDIDADLKDLMKKWNVDENNVKPLKQQCRRMILNHLSPQADKKITKMSLPSTIVSYLNIPELDDILTACTSESESESESE